MQKCLKAYTFENLEENWQDFLGSCLHSAGIRDINTYEEVPISSGLTKKQIAAINSRLKENSITIDKLITDEDIASLNIPLKTVTNKSRFPDVDFLRDDEITEVGTIGTTTLLLVGKERGTNSPIVAKSYSPTDSSEELFAIPLFSLLNSQEPINITEELEF